MRTIISTLVFIPTLLMATLAGNPGQPAIEKQGILQGKNRKVSFRAGYYGDYVYHQKFKDEFTLEGETVSEDDFQSWTQAGLFTFNFKERVDIYTIVGGLRVQLNDAFKTQQQFAWGVGGKILFLNSGRFRAGCDLKYFQSDQAPAFFEQKEKAYNITSDYYCDYSEFQVALGLSYQSKYVSPYLSGTYLISKLQPKPAVIYVKMPNMDLEVPATIKSSTTKNRFGTALGLSLIDQSKATLSIEWRAINQNSINLTGDLRF